MFNRFWFPQAKRMQVRDSFSLAHPVRVEARPFGLFPEGPRTKTRVFSLQFCDSLYQKQGCRKIVHIILDAFASLPKCRTRPREGLKSYRRAAASRKGPAKAFKSYRCAAASRKGPARALSRISARPLPERKGPAKALSRIVARPLPERAPRTH